MRTRLLLLCCLFPVVTPAATHFTNWTGTFGSGPTTTPIGTLDVGGSASSMSIIGTYVSTGTKFDGSSTQFSDASVFNPALPASDSIFMALGPSNASIILLTSVTLDQPVLYIANVGDGLSFTVTSDSGSAFSVLGSSAMTQSGNQFTSTGANGLLALSFTSSLNEVDLIYISGSADAVALQLGNGTPMVVPEPGGITLVGASALLILLRRIRRFE
jgi:hypothetical protein